MPVRTCLQMITVVPERNHRVVNIHSGDLTLGGLELLESTVSVYVCYICFVIRQFLLSL